ncbi:MAG TPA: hypothetical protein VF476_07760 [Chitinophagaceae bacterium]
MVYRSLGILFSGNGFTLAFAEFHENAGKWNVETGATESYPAGPVNPLISGFIEKHNLQYRIAMITLHTEVSDTIFNGASVAAATKLPVITDLPAMDIELGGNGEFYSFAAQKLNIEKDLPGSIAKATCIGLMGILRWREEYNFLSSQTGASRSTIGGALWTGQEA